MSMVRLIALAALAFGLGGCSTYDSSYRDGYATRQYVGDGSYYYPGDAGAGDYYSGQSRYQDDYYDDGYGPYWGSSFGYRHGYGVYPGSGFQLGIGFGWPYYSSFYPRYGNSWYGGYGYRSYYPHYYAPRYWRHRRHYDRRNDEPLLKMRPAGEQGRYGDDTTTPTQARPGAPLPRQVVPGADGRWRYLGEPQPQPRTRDRRDDDAAPRATPRPIAPGTDLRWRQSQPRQPRSNDFRIADPRALNDGRGASTEQPRRVWSNDRAQQDAAGAVYRGRQFQAGESGVTPGRRSIDGRMAAPPLPRPQEATDDRSGYSGASARPATPQYREPRVAPRPAPEYRQPQPPVYREAPRRQQSQDSDDSPRERRGDGPNRPLIEP